MEGGTNTHQAFSELKSDEHSQSNLRETAANDSEIQQESNSSTYETLAESNMNSPVSNDWNKINSNNDGDTQKLLFKAASLGNWDTAQKFLDQYPDAVRARITFSQKSALHIAVTNGHLNFVEKLVERMTEKDLEMEQQDGFTSLVVAILKGSMPIAQCLIRKNPKLISIVHRSGRLPVQHAVYYGQRKMVSYLYSITPLEDLTSLNNGRHGSDLLALCIYEEHFDIALHLMGLAPHLAITENDSEKLPVGVLAKSKMFPSGCSLRFWQQWVYNCISIPDTLKQADGDWLVTINDSKDITESSPGLFRRYTQVVLGILPWMVSNLQRLLDIKKMYETKLAHIQIRELLSRVCKVIESTSEEMEIIRAGVRQSIILAAYQGNIEFITSLAKANPELAWNPSIASTVLHIAVKLRQPRLYSLVLHIAPYSNITVFTDKNKNTILQKVAVVAPPRLLNQIPGAALQMQSELQWFKEVGTITPLRFRELLNNSGCKPRAEFTESHKDLVIAGEKWMKETSSSSSVVGALIVTVTFAAAFTFPGGNNQNSGFPMFANMKLFRVFMLSNTVALLSSTTSVLMFLGILTSRYAEEDFLRSLPTKLIIGLSTLFLSIASMIITFCVGLSIMFHGQPWIFVPAACLASVPVALFVWMQFPLLRDITMSTYGPSAFNRNVKHWI